MDTKGDAMEVDAVSSVPIPITLDSAVQSLLSLLETSLRTFVERQISIQLGPEMVSSFMPDSSSTCLHFLDFIDRKWIALFSDSSLSSLRHTVLQTKSLLKGVQSHLTSDGILVPSSTSANDIAQAVETLLMAIAPSRAVEAAHVRRAIPLIRVQPKSPTIGEKVAKTVHHHSEMAVILDGSNVAWHFGHSKTFLLRGALLALQYFQNRGHAPVIIFLPEGRMNSSCRDDDAVSYDELDNMRGRGSVVLIPGTDYDDAYMCTYARKVGGIVVSNDLYRDVVYQASASGPLQADEWSQWLTACRLSFTFRVDEFIPNPSFTWSRAARVAESLKKF